MSMSKPLRPLALLLLLFLAGCAWIPRSVLNRTDHSGTTKYEIVEGSPLYALIQRGWIQPVNAPRFTDVVDASSFMEAHEPVMIVARGDDVRIYSTWYLDGHEVVNDVIGGEPVAVTWCPLVQAGTAFGRTISIDGEQVALTLQASGKLWRDALVMYDKQTESLWTQHDGRALQGVSRERNIALPMIPSTHTSWTEASARHPAARVLRKKPDLLGSGERTIYDDYLDRTDQLGIFGTHLADDSLPGKSLVFGFVRPESAYALSIPGLQGLGGAAISVGGDPVFAHVLPGAKDARVWYRATAGSSELLDLRLSSPGEITDAGRGLRWDVFDGRSLDPGGHDLRGIDGKIVYFFAWQQNYPLGRVWDGGSFADPRATVAPASMQ